MILTKKRDPLINWISAYLPPLLWAALIFSLSNQAVLPSLTVSLYDFLFKKMAHITVYAVLYFLTWRAVSMTSSPRAKTKQWLLPLIICLIYATSDELHQSFTPGRHPTVRDIGYDLLGMILALFYQYKYI